MTGDDFDATAFLTDVQRDLDAVRAQLTQAQDDCQDYRSALLRIKGHLTKPAAPVIQWFRPDERG